MATDMGAPLGMSTATTALLAWTGEFVGAVAWLLTLLALVTHNAADAAFSTSGSAATTLMTLDRLGGAAHEFSHAGGGLLGALRVFLGGGLSHLLEHLVAGGTNERRSEEQNKTLLQEIGNNSNAYTTSDHTAYAAASLFRFRAVSLMLDVVSQDEW